MDQNQNNANEIAQLQQQIASMQQRLAELSSQQASEAAHVTPNNAATTCNKNATSDATVQSEAAAALQAGAQPANTVDIVDAVPISAQTQHVEPAQTQPIVDAVWTVEQAAPAAQAAASAQPATQTAAQAAPAQQANAQIPAQPAQQQANQQHPLQSHYQNAQAYYSQVGYQAPYQQNYQPSYVHAKDHVVAGLLAIFLGAFGIHKFYLGYNSAGFILLGVTIIGSLFTFGMAAGVVWIVSLIEGILYLTKDPSEFQNLYVANRREWF